MDSLVKKLFSLNLSVMRVFGLYPTKTHQSLYKMYAYSVYVCFILPTPILTLTNLLFGDDVDLNVIAQNAFAVAETGCFVFKLLQFIMNAEKIKKCIYIVECPIFKTYSSYQEHIMNECIRVCTRNSKFFLFVCFVTAGSWAIVPLFLNEYKLPLDIWLPYDIRNGGMLYILSYIFLVIGVYLDSLSNGVIDPLCGGLIYFAATQTKILKDNLQNISKHSEEYMQGLDDIDKELKSRVVYHKIKFCVKHHKAILEFVETYEDTFSSMAFTQFSASVVVICISCLQLSIVEPFTANFYSMLIFINAVLMQILFYCYYGTILYEESNSLTTAVYMSEWYEYDERSKRALIILMEGCKKSITLKAGKILDLSLDTFTMILRRSYSLLAVLKNY